MIFTLDQTAAVAETFSPGRIDKTGLYIGHFINAYERKSTSSDSVAMHLDFISITGKSGSVDLWHTGRDGTNNDKNGKKLSGYNQVMSLMSLLGIQQLKPKPNVQIKKWDNVLKGFVDAYVTGYPQLIDKPIGAVFQMSKDPKQISVDGKWVTAQPVTYWDNAECLGFCDAETKLSAGGIDMQAWADKLEPVKWPKEAVQAMDAQLIKQAQSAPNAPNEGADFDDDMPF